MFYFCAQNDLMRVITNEKKNKKRYELVLSPLVKREIDD